MISIKFIRPRRGKGGNAKVLSTSESYTGAETQGSKETVVGKEAATGKGKLMKGPKYQAW